MLIFHNHRRDLIAKTLFDIFKLSFVASCISGFFPGFHGPTKILIFFVIGISFLLGIIICPESDKEN